MPTTLTNFSNRNLIPGTSAVKASSQSFAPINVNAGTVFVELQQTSAKAKVLRKGLQVPAIIVDVAKLDPFLGDLEILKPSDAPRVLNQSIVAGTKVGVGTEVDLVLAEKATIPVRIFDDMHVALEQESIQDVINRLNTNKDLVNLVLKYENIDDVEPNDLTVMTGMMEKIDISINEAEPRQGVSNAFNTLRTALAFA